MSIEIDPNRTPLELHPDDARVAFRVKGNIVASWETPSAPQNALEGEAGPEPVPTPDRASLTVCEPFCVPCAAWRADHSE